MYRNFLLYFHKKRKYERKKKKEMVTLCNLNEPEYI